MEKGKKILKKIILKWTVKKRLISNQSLKKNSEKSLKAVGSNIGRDSEQGVEGDARISSDE